MDLFIHLLAFGGQLKKSQVKVVSAAVDFVDVLCSKASRFSRSFNLEGMRKANVEC